MFRIFAMSFSLSSPLKKKRKKGVQHWNHLIKRQCHVIRPLSKALFSVLKKMFFGWIIKAKKKPFRLILTKHPSRRLYSNGFSLVSFKISQETKYFFSIWRSLSICVKKVIWAQILLKPLEWAKFYLKTLKNCAEKFALP